MFALQKPIGKYCLLKILKEIDEYGHYVFFVALIELFSEPKLFLCLNFGLLTEVVRAY